jgi:predicted AAA+ superfamily ATPase
MAGAFFETFVISEVMKSYSSKGILDLPLYFYRGRDGNEIDLLIEDSGILYPTEIKKHADPQKSDVAAFGLLDKIPAVKRGTGGMVCLYDSLTTLKENDRTIPVNML